MSERSGRLSSNACRGSPHLECFQPRVADGEGGTTAGRDRELIAGCGLHRDETLQSTRRPEALHCSLSFLERQMAVLCSVVETLVRSMIKTVRDLAFCGSIGSQFVPNDPFGHETPTFRQLDQKPLCGPLVPPGLQDFVKNYAVLVDCTPEPVRPACDCHDDFV